MRRRSPIFQLLFFIAAIVLRKEILMMRSLRIGVFCLAAATALGRASPTRANLVTNGDFENPTVSGGFNTVTSLPGWTVSAGHVNVTGSSSVDQIGSYWTA